MKRNSIMALLMIFVLAAFILLLNNGITRSQLDEGQAEVVCKVVEVDDSDLVISGVAMLGGQRLKGEVASGAHKGEIIEINNTFMGQFEYDQYYEVGNRVLVGAIIVDGSITKAVAIDLVRHNYIIILFGIFAVFLLIYAGKVGLRALISFVVSLLIIWFILVPLLLNGFPPIPLTLFTLILLSAVIIFSVAGFSRKALSAFLGAVSGLAIPIALALIFGDLMKLEGLSAPFAGNLMMRGYMNLNFQDIFYSAILIGASGACMDIAMDVAASMDEIHQKRPDISRSELMKSGLTIGRAVIGTMTTTLLLAYSGSYLTLMMLFNISGTSLIRLLNMKVFTSEFMRIIIGSLALLLVAPITALISAYILKRNKKNPDKGIVLKFDAMMEKQEKRKLDA